MSLVKSHSAGKDLRFCRLFCFENGDGGERKVKKRETEREDGGRGGERGEGDRRARESPRECVRQGQRERERTSRFLHVFIIIIITD